jgi:predicted nucleic acid-binding protein
MEIARRSGYSIFDCLVIAAAPESGSTILYTEDMRGGQKLDGLKIVNPFSGMA